MGLMGGGVGDTRLEGQNGSRQQLSTDTQSSASSSEPTDRPASAGLKPETKSLSHLPSDASVVPSLPCVATTDAAPAELDRSLAEVEAEAAIAMLRSDRHARPESALTADNPFFQPAAMDFDMPARGGGSNIGGVIVGGSRTSAPSTSNPHAVSGRPQSMTGKSSVPLAGAPNGVNRLVDTSVSHSPVLGMAPARGWYLNTGDS